MAKIILEVPDELSEQLAQVGDVLGQAASRLRLPELLALSLQQPQVPARIYQYILGVPILSLFTKPNIIENLLGLLMKLHPWGSLLE